MSLPHSVTSVRQRRFAAWFGLVLLISGMNHASRAAAAEDIEDTPADAEQVARPQPNPPQLDNPLKNLIQRVFQPNGPIFPPQGPRAGRRNRPRHPQRNAPDDENENRPVNPSDRDYIDSRAPHDAKIEHQLRTAQAAIQKRDWVQAVKLLQQLLDLPEDSLHRQPDGRWQSIRLIASRELGRAPAEVWESYQQQYGGLAKQSLADAVRDGDVALVIRVATRYFHTDAGYEAADFLAMMHYDRAEFGIACQWLDELQASRAALIQSPAWRLKAASIYRHAGRSDAAERLLAGAAVENQTVVAAGVTTTAKEWLTSLPDHPAATTAALYDWQQIYGNSSRSGLQTGGAPFLMAQWQVPYTSSHAVRQRLEWMLQELADQNRPTLLAAQPLAVAGKGIYRDLRGVHVVDLETGSTLWESLEGVSAERVATGIAQVTDPDQAAGIPFHDDFTDPFGGQGAENHPLINLMLRDASYNTISSDGRQVFLIEDQGILSRQHPGYHWGWDGEQADPYGFSWTTNRLSSYDLTTGRPLWTVGGPESNESFQLSLAGVYFFGVPTPEADDLFAIGSKGDEVRLWCLDRRTGGLRWSQLIGYSDTKVDQDIARRWMAAIPSVADGIVVCPTNIGWLVAVDRQRRSVLWAVRYSQPTPGQDAAMGNNIAPFQELGGQWGGSAPLILGQHVLYTPPEDDLLICVDLVTGEKRWEIPRESGLYLAGATEDRAIVVSLGQIAAFALADGKKLWTVDIGDEAFPSGRAALTGEQLFLPLNTGELRVLELANGKTSLRTFLPAGQHALGNLVLHDGRILSLGPQGVSGFRQQAALLAEIQQRKARHPLDPQALLSEAEIHLLNREAGPALALLKQIAPNDLTAELQARLHGNQITGLTAMIRQNLSASEEPLAELGRIAATPAERLLHLDLSAERFLALGQHVPAFDLYWKLTAEPSADFVTRTDDAKVLVHRPVWLSGRLRDVWTAAEGETKSQIDARIAETLAQSAASNDAARNRLWQLLGFHPSTRPLLRQALDARLQSGNWASLELDLLRLAESSEPESAAWATWKLGELMERQQLPYDAAYHYRRLETLAGVLPDGRSGADVVREIRQAGRVPFTTESRGPAWDDRALKMTQLPYAYSQPNQELATESRLPFFDIWNMEYLQQQQRLSFEPKLPEDTRWLAPLRSSAGNRHNGLVSADTVGHFLAVVHHEVLHVLSPIRKEVLWTLSLDGLAEGGLPPAYGNRPPIAPMWTVQQGNGMRWEVAHQVEGYQRLPVSRPEYLAVNGRRAVHLLDARTGEELWRRTNVQPNTSVAGGPTLLYLIPTNMQQSVAYRVSDGTPVAIDRLDQHLAHSIGLVGDDLLLVETGTGLKFLGFDRTKTVVRRHNPLTKVDVWKQEFGTGTMISRLSAEELFVVPASGAAELVDVTSGKRQPLDRIGSKDLQSRSECYALVDDERIYLMVNSNAGGYHHFAESLPSVRAHGTLFAWQRSTGKLLWKQALNNQHLIVDHFRGSPVLVFCSREWKQQGVVNFSQLSLLVLHKATGKVVHESSTPTMYNGFHSVALLPAEQAVELRSFNLRIKLSPADQPADPPAAKGSD